MQPLLNSCVNLVSLTDQFKNLTQNKMETMNLLKGFKSAPSPENTRAIPGGVFNFLSMGHETDGGHALMRIVVNRGAEPPAHTHSREDESYYILNGSVRYTIGKD